MDSSLHFSPWLSVFLHAHGGPTYMRLAFLHVSHHYHPVQEERSLFLQAAAPTYQ